LTRKGAHVWSGKGKVGKRGNIQTPAKALLANYTENMSFTNSKKKRKPELFWERCKF